VDDQRWNWVIIPISGLILWDGGIFGFDTIDFLFTEISFDRLGTKRKIDVITLRQKAEKCKIRGGETRLIRRGSAAGLVVFDLGK